MTVSQRASKAAQYLNAPLPVYCEWQQRGGREEWGRKETDGENEVLDGWTRRGLWGGLVVMETQVCAGNGRKLVVVVVGLIRDGNEILNREEKIA